MHPALQSWRDELPSSSVRILAYLGAVALLSIAAARVSQPPARVNIITPAHRPEWVEIERPFPAFALSIPEAADVPANYAIRRHAEGGGRKDVLTLGDPDSATPLSASRDLPAGKRNPSVPRSEGGNHRQRRRTRTCRGAAWRQTSHEQVRRTDDRHLRDVERDTTPLPGFRTYLSRSAVADIRLVLPGRRRIDRTKHIGVCIGSIDIAVRRKRSEDWRTVRTGRTQSQLLRPTRSNPRRNAEIPFALEGTRKRPEPRRSRALSDARCVAPSPKSHSMRLHASRANDFAQRHRDDN